MNFENLIKINKIDLFNNTPTAQFVQKDFNQEIEEKEIIVDEDSADFDCNYYYDLHSVDNQTKDFHSTDNIYFNCYNMSERMSVSKSPQNQEHIKRPMNGNYPLDNLIDNFILVKNYREIFISKVCTI